MYGNLDILMRFLAASDVAYSEQIVDDDIQNQDLVVTINWDLVKYLEPLFAHRNSLGDWEQFRLHEVLRSPNPQTGVHLLAWR